jgi:HSP20 family molecular chaperone IbpA
MEIAYSHFERSVLLPGRLDREHFVVEHRHGMLLVRIRREADQP